MPSNLDGHVIQGLVAGASRRWWPLCQVESADSANTEDQAKLSPEEEQLVEEKLRGLGYL